MPKKENERLTDEMEPQTVKKRRIGATDTLTIPALFRRTFKAIRDAERFEARIERTPEGRMLLVFEAKGVTQCNGN